MDFFFFNLNFGSVYSAYGERRPLRIRAPPHRKSQFNHCPYPSLAVPGHTLLSTSSPVFPRLKAIPPSLRWLTVFLRPPTSLLFQNFPPTSWSNMSSACMASPRTLYRTEAPSSPHRYGGHSAGLWAPLPASPRVSTLSLTGNRKEPTKRWRRHSAASPTPAPPLGAPSCPGWSTPITLC